LRPPCGALALSLNKKWDAPLLILYICEIGLLTAATVLHNLGKCCIKKHHVDASPDEPQYLVKSDKRGKEAAHKPESLHDREA